MRIAMIGTGYVGLVSGACFSEFGVSVVCVDQDGEKIARLEAAGITVAEEISEIPNLIRDRIGTVPA